MLLSAQGAPIVSEWVGLRPARDTVRLETETVCVGNRKVKVKLSSGHMVGLRPGHMVGLRPGSRRLED